MIARQIAIGFGIAVLFPLLVYYGVSTFSPPPTYLVYFAAQDALGARQPHEQGLSDPQDQAARQQRAKTANEAFAKKERVFSLRLLCVAAPLGYAAILFGGLRVSSGLGAGLMFGGIFSVLDGYWAYWHFIEDWLRFVSLLLAAAVLVYVSFRQLPGRLPRP